MGWYGGRICGSAQPEGSSTVRGSEALCERRMTLRGSNGSPGRTSPSSVSDVQLEIHAGSRPQVKPMSGLERSNERGAKDPEIETAQQQLQQHGQQLEVASQRKPLEKRPLKVSRSGKAAGTSYAALIASVLQTAPERRLTLPEIADELRRRHPCFAGPDTAWRNSVRHTLSVSGAFVKVPRDPARPWAKANYWALAAALDDYLRPDGTFRLRRRRRTRTAGAAFPSEPNSTSEVKFRSSFSIETLLGSPSPSPGSICTSTPPSSSFGPGLAPVRFTSAALRPRMDKETETSPGTGMSCVNVSILPPGFDLNFGTSCLFAPPGHLLFPVGQCACPGSLAPNSAPFPSWPLTIPRYEPSVPLPFPFGSCYLAPPVC